MLDMIIEKLKGIVDYYFVLATIGIGIVTLILDVSWLNKQGVREEAKIAKGIGTSYIILGPLIYVVLKFI